MIMESRLLVEELENILLAVSEQDKAAITKLTAVIREAPEPLPAAVTAVLLDNLELIVDDLEAVAREADRRAR